MTPLFGFQFYDWDKCYASYAYQRGWSFGFGLMPVVAMGRIYRHWFERLEQRPA